MRGRIAVCSEHSLGWEFDTRSPTVAEVGTGWLAWLCASTAKPVVGAVVKTGENAVVLNRR